MGEKIFKIDNLLEIVDGDNSKYGTFVDTVLIGRRESGQAAPQNTNAAVKPNEHNLYSGNIIKIGNVHIQVKISGEQPDYTPPQVAQSPSKIKVVADKAIEWLKIWLEIPTSIKEDQKSAIGGYKIVKKLGEGGYGQVFLAENALGKQIAIKAMLAEVAATPAKVKMFEREIDNAKALNHPNVVRLTDNGFDASNNCLFYGMEYCAGDNLAVFVEKMGGILNLDLTKRLIFQILDGLEYTHTAEIPFVRLADHSFGKGVGLVHRDRNPDIPALLAEVIDRSTIVPSPTISTDSKNECLDLPTRMAKANITAKQVDKVFFQTYPDRSNKPLGNIQLDRSLRQEWCAVANKLIQ